MILRPLPAIFVVLLALCSEVRAFVSAACPMPRIANGYGLLRSRGRLARFRCAIEFELHGPRYLECIRGKWDQPLPMCLKRGCPQLSHPNGVLTISETGTQVTLNCHANYMVAGAQTAYCDGTNWDRALGNCRQVLIGPATWCDFEVDTCDWTVEAPNSNEWRRNNGIASSSRLFHSVLMRTGPQHDHTVGRPLEGYFMVAQMGDITMQDTARLISPLYTAEQGTDACFRLWYHMFGRQVGRLRVYVRQQGADIEMSLDERNVLFEKNGNQNNVWHEELIALDTQTQEFQIVIEAMASEGRYSDIAIDDVALLQGANCRNEQDTMAEQTTPAEEEPGGVFDVASCAGRCGSAGVFAAGYSATLGVQLNCSCTESCSDLGSCCLDYNRLCLFNDSSSGDLENPTTIQSTTITVTVPTTTSKSTSTTSTSTSTTRRTSTTTTPKPRPKPTQKTNPTRQSITKAVSRTSSTTQTTTMSTTTSRSTTHADAVTDNAINSDAEIVSNDKFSFPASKIDKQSSWLVWTLVLCSAAAIAAVVLVITFKGGLIALPVRPSSRKDCSEVRFLIENDDHLDIAEPSKKQRSVASVQCDNLM